MIGDIHLGDWGYQMGLIITELKKRQPDLPYFDESYEGEYPEEAPFTIGELEEIYPTASATQRSTVTGKRHCTPPICFRTDTEDTVLSGITL